MYVYDPSEAVTTEATLPSHPSTNKIGSPPNPTPFSVSSPETVKVVLCVGFDGNAKAVREVEIGFRRDPVFRFKVIEPGPVKLTVEGLGEPEQLNPPEQLQPETV